MYVSNIDYFQLNIQKSDSILGRSFLIIAENLFPLSLALRPLWRPA